MSDDILTLPPRPPTKRERYGECQSQFGHLHLPSIPGPHPVAVALHGGFWRAKYDLSHLDHLCAALARNGIAVWSLEYRRTGEDGGGWPGTFDDVLAGIRHLHRLSTQHPIDTNRLILLGHSAGGHLALWAAAELGEPNAESESNAGSRLYATSDAVRVRGVISLAGVADLKCAAELNLSDGAVQELLGGGPADEPARYRSASPIQRVPIGTPQILFHGTDDDCVPVEIAQAYARAARAVGDEVELRIMEDLGHYELIDPRADVFKEIADAVSRLLEET